MTPDSFSFAISLVQFVFKENGQNDAENRKRDLKDRLRKIHH